MAINRATIDALSSPIFTEKKIEVSMLRLDTIHPQIAGNKGYKLIYFIENAIAQHKTGIVTFGGAYSNHLHATAYMCKQLGLQSVGIVRGEVVENETLKDCKKWGMQLFFYNRNYFVNEIEKTFHASIQEKFPTHYLVPMGGDSPLGIEGASNIYTKNNLQNYTHIVCSVGTGTTLLGIINASNEQQKIIGISAGKDKKLANHFTAFANKNNYTLLQNYTLGGFGKTTASHINYILGFYTQHNIALDIVYTSKMMLALDDLIDNNFFPENAKIICIHTGGTQGNRSEEALKNLTIL